MLENNFADCPWPVPPSAILMHLPIKEQKQKGMTSEAVLRQIVSRDKKQRHCYQWLIRDVNVRPDKTFWDDGTDARVKPQRHYAFRTDRKPMVAENRWATFLNHWTSTDLACATNLVCAHVYSDLSCQELDLLHTLRAFHDVLLLKKDDPLHAYQMRLRSLHRMGIVLSPERTHRCQNYCHGSAVSKPVCANLENVHNVRNLRFHEFGPSTICWRRN